MKKTVALTHPTLKPARLVDSIKHDVKKYLKRERNKQLPKGSDYWSFDCRIGATQDAAEKVFPSEINKRIDELVAQGCDDFYIEVLAKAMKHQPKDHEAYDDDEFFED